MQSLKGFLSAAALGFVSLTLGACAAPTQPAVKAAPKAAMVTKPANAVPMAFASAPAVGTKATCPVSGEVFTVKEGTERSEFGGKHFAFCCSGCKTKFDAAPAKFGAK